MCFSAARPLLVELLGQALEPRQENSLSQERSWSIDVA